MRGRLHLLLWAAAIAALALAAAAPDRALPAFGGMADADLASLRARLVGEGAPPRPIAGFAIAAHHISDPDLYLESVDAIAAMGANALLVVTPMYQETVASNEIRFVAEKCATDEQLRAILQRGRARGLFTALLPIVLIERPGEKEWRGVIRPTDWDAWWASYEDFLDRFVALANEALVDLLFIGSELNTTEDQVGRWGPLINNVRQRYSGVIAYSANWDRYEKVALWPLVDLMAVSSYFELHEPDASPGVQELTEAWAARRDRLLAFASELDRPLLLSEVGYPTLPWATAYPWNYVPEPGMEADDAARARQAAGWRAFFRAWTPALADRDGRAAGFFGYRWDPYHDGWRNDTGYGVRGKPAYDVVRDGLADVLGAAGR